MKTRIFSRIVILLSLVSLLNDISSEMLYPVMPMFLQSIGFNAFWIGLVEGMAQVIIGFSTGYFGLLSDRWGKRMPFIRGGYFISTFSKPVMALVSSVPLVFFARVAERFGKGVRVSARDALLSDESAKGKTGRVFGFHRAMDTIGAAIGPGFALWYLVLHPADYRSLFLVAFIPGLLASVLTLFIREKKIERKLSVEGKGFFSFLGYWKRAGKAYRLITFGLLAFALLNSADAFLFLMCKQAGLSDRDLIMSYILYNLIYAVFSLPAGYLADRFGMRNVMITGFVFFTITYAGFSQLHSVTMLYFLFVIYGLFGSFTEGIGKAWITLHSNKGDKGTALGFYKSLSSFMALLASIITGWIWMSVSPALALAVSAIGTGFIILYFLIFLRAKDESPGLT